MSFVIVETQELSKLREFFDKVKGDNRFYRLAKPFKTSNNFYVYDVGTGKVFSIRKEVYDVLSSLIKTDNFDELLGLELSEWELVQALNEIKESINSENILSAPTVKCFNGPQSLALEDYINNGMNQLTLEVTEKCNLRCSYCIYSHHDFHDFSERNMTFETAKKAIDLGHKNCNDSFYLAFYGGEPLLNIDLIKECVSYSKDLFKNKSLSYSMTTNGVLLSKELAKYFAENDFIILLSLDGPKDIHDENRKFKNGVGSYDYAVNGLKYLLEAYGDKAESYIFLSMVTSGPNLEEKYNKIQEFFDNEDWIPNLNVNTSYVSHGRKYEKYVMPTSKMDDLYNEMSVDPLMDWSIEKQNWKFNKKLLFSNGQLQKKLHLIHRRDITDKPMENYYFNGCCVPGSRRLHINVDGNFLPCERVGTVPFLGNIDTGFDFEKIKKYYVDDFSKEASKYCNECWAVHICGSCYIECYDEDNINLDYRHSGCKYIRHNLEKSLILYHEILEKNPESLNMLNDIVIE